MKVHFFKYQGTGNDFVIVDNRENKISLTQEQVAFICDRRFGVGADGLMLLNSRDGYDFEMIYYNSDGRPGSMCGNGGRCLVRFAHEIGIQKEHYQFMAVDGRHEAKICKDGTVALKMNDVQDVQHQSEYTVLDTGSPHAVQQVSDVWRLDVLTEGRNIRYSEPFKEKGINVNFIEPLVEGGGIVVRTYERGVEDETYSCGTGVTAAAVAYMHHPDGPTHVPVKTKGGELSVSFEKKGDRFENIWLQGPAEKVFEGHITI